MGDPITNCERRLDRKKYLYHQSAGRDVKGITLREKNPCPPSILLFGAPVSDKYFLFQGISDARPSTA
jgi:hypothetical protein